VADSPNALGKGSPVGAQDEYSVRKAAPRACRARASRPDARQPLTAAGPVAYPQLAGPSVRRAARGRVV